MHRGTSASLVPALQFLRRRGCGGAEYEPVVAGTGGNEALAGQDHVGRIERRNKRFQRLKRLRANNGRDFHPAWKSRSEVSEGKT